MASEANKDYITIPKEGSYPLLFLEYIARYTKLRVIEIEDRDDYFMVYLKPSDETRAISEYMNSNA